MTRHLAAVHEGKGNIELEYRVAAVNAAGTSVTSNTVVAAP
ncbi:MAG TPA: hypothetical protein VMZ06_04590 [Candidatus Bathyarchaeia archaeon]|nr:hypothetical protein [Candidatus Bathyarchaeia archaeon]